MLTIWFYIYNYQLKSIPQYKAKSVPTIVSVIALIL